MFYYASFCFIILCLSLNFVEFIVLLVTVEVKGFRYSNRSYEDIKLDNLKVHNIYLGLQDCCFIEIDIYIIYRIAFHYIWKIGIYIVMI